MNSIRSSVTGVFQSLVNAAYSWGADICSEMTRGINANASKVIAAAQALASEVDDIIGFSVPETGPLSDADEYMPDFMKLLAGGITSNMGRVLDKVEELAAQIREQMQVSGLKDIPKLAGSLRMPELAMAGGGTTTTTTNNNQRTINMGGIHLTVNGYNVQNDDQLAAMVANKINDMMEEDGSVFK
jgi:hypothetical protein